MEEKTAGGSTAAEGSRGRLHASSLPFGNAGRALTRKLGFSAALTLAFPAWTPPWAEQGFSQGSGFTESEANLPSRGVLEQQYFCQSFLANLLLWAGTQSCCCPLRGDL